MIVLDYSTLETSFFEKLEIKDQRTDRLTDRQTDGQHLLIKCPRRRLKIGRYVGTELIQAQPKMGQSEKKHILEIFFPL